ncbi:MAG: YciI family protein [Xanthomonadaceae bacterium]|nr:YciI family protein [Xanthomonadaceae bacterium]
MRNILGPVAALLLMSTPASATQPLPTEWQTLYAAFLTPTTGGPTLSDDAQRLLQTLHIQYQLQLQADGKAIVGGGFAAGEGPIGMTLLCAASAEEAEALANADPAVQFGQITVAVRAWHVPAGRVRCVSQ